MRLRVDLSTTYLGLKLANPLIPRCPAPGSTRDEGEGIRALVDVGAPAMLMDPIYEEQISHGTTSRLWYEQEAPDARGGQNGHLARDIRGNYLDRIASIRKLLPGPLIAAINCTTLNAWVDFTRSLEAAGADALELNVYVLPTDPDEPASDVERRVVDIVSAVRARVKIPLAVKLSPFYTSLSHFAKRLEAVGVDGLVLFNRFYEPEFDEGRGPRGGGGRMLDSLEMRLRLGWLSILSPQTQLSLALSGGVQTGRDVIEGVMAGAAAVHINLAALNAGPEYLETVLEGLSYQMEKVSEAGDQGTNESITRLRGCMNRARRGETDSGIAWRSAARPGERITVNLH
jgi:dihydroorotate dehydrogenase (fumarate)